MPAFSNAAFATAAFSNVAFDFGTGPTPPVVIPPGNTPGFNRKWKLKAQLIKEETEEEKYKRRLAMGIISPEEPTPPPKRRNGLKRAIWKKR